MAKQSEQDKQIEHSRSKSQLQIWLEALTRDKRKSRLLVGKAYVEIDLTRQATDRIGMHYAQRGIFSNQVLAEMALSGLDLSKEAERIGISELQLAAVFQEVLASVSDEILAEMEDHLAAPKGRGELDIDDPDYEKWYIELGLDKIKEVGLEEIDAWLDVPNIGILYLRGPINAIDHRPFLGDARNQAGRGTCTAFCSTCVAEGLEYLRDPRPGPRNLSEQLIFWYSKTGQRYTGGGYGCGAALRHHSEYGACEEFYFPYDTRVLPANHAHVPMPDEAMDRAQFYRTSTVVKLPARNVDAMKAVLLSGRCAGVVSDTHGWASGTGIVSMPDPPNSIGIGGGHCTAIIGFIDRDDLHPDLEGGYFIIRNSHGGAGSTTHLMGPEYGGHLLMPYGWYRRYTDSAYTLADDQRRDEHERKWLVEYYENRSLRGAPLKRKTVEVQVFMFTRDIEVSVPEMVDEVNFDWGTGSALRYDLPFPLGEVDVLPKDNFSIRFTKVKSFRNGWYRFRLRGDDGIRLYVDDCLVINAWKDQPATEYLAEHYLTGGDHVLRVEYYERGDRAAVSLQIEPIIVHYELFSNPSLAGDPHSAFDDTLTELEWRHAPPISSVNQGVFSLRGTVRLAFKGGTYRFHAIHTGGCRMYVGNQRVLNDWNGTNPSGSPVAIAEGTHQVIVEYKHETPVPPPGTLGYYRAALNYGWSEEWWDAAFYQDPARRHIAEAGWPHPDSRYEGVRTQALTGNPIFQHHYPSVNSTPGQYLAADGLPLRLRFAELAEFSNGIAGAPDLDTDYLSVHLRRRIFLQETGYYNVELLGGGGSRVVVDGKEILEDHEPGGTATNADLYLKAGCHELALEWSIEKWRKYLDFTLDRVAWSVSYFDGTDFDTWAAEKTLDSIARIIPERPASVGSSWYSVRARRTVTLPLGRYRFQLRTDDGARLKINGITQIDAWTDQPARNYHTEIEHKGGNLSLVLEYYQKGGGATLELVVAPVGYYGEYYRGISLQKTEAGAALDRNVPIAYRFEPDINFDWGGGNRLARVGADYFSARWRGRLHLPVGRWRAEVTADDGIRLFVGGRLLIDEWKRQPATTHARMIDLVGGHHDITLEYFEQTGKAVCKLRFVRLW